MRRRVLEGAALLVIFGLLAVYAGRQIWDIDVFWHVVAGRLFAELRGLPSRDTFSAIDPDREWIPLVWGYEMLVYLLDRAGGLAAIRAAHWAVQLSAFAIFWWGLRRRVRLDAAPAIALLALAILLYADRFRERPHVFNLLAEAILIPWLVVGPEALGRKEMIASAAIGLLWANIHAGGAFVFFAIALAFPAAAVVEILAGVPGSRERARQGIGWYAALIVPAVLTPGFVRGIAAHFTQIGASEVITPEWGPSWRYFERGTIAAHFFMGAFPTALALVWALPAARVLREALRGSLREVLGRVSAYDLLLALALLLFAHRSIRFVYFGAYAVVPTARALAGAYRIELPPAPIARASAALAAVFVVLGYQHRILFQYGSLERAVRTVFTGGPLDESRFPIAAVDHLERTGFTGNVFVQPRWGGYLLYRMWPKVHVTADGRGNYSEQVVLDLWRVSDPRNFVDASTGPQIQAIYERYPVDALLLGHPVWPPGHAPIGWTLAHSDEIAEVWLRAKAAR